MDRIQSRGRRAVRRLAALGALSLAGIGTPWLSHGDANGEEARPAPTPASRTAPAAATSWVEGVTRTKAKGPPTVLIVTSKANPASAEVARSALSSPALSRLKGSVQVAELVAEDEPEQVKKMMVTRFPTFVGLRANAEGRLEVAGSRLGAMSADEMLGWVWGVGLAAPVDPDAGPTAGGPDTGVVRAGLFHGSRQAGPSPSPQQPQCPSPQAPVKYVPVAPPPPPAQEVEREVEVIREVVVEEAPREVVREVVVEAPAPREVVREVVREVAAPRTAVTREVTAAPRNVLTRAAAPVRERQVIVQRTVAAPPPTREVVREVVREVAPPTTTREVVREVAAPRAVEAVPAQRGVQLIRPGLFGRALGGFGERLRVAALPRIDVAVEQETRYRPVAPRDKAVYLTETAPQMYAVEAAPRQAQAYAPCPPQAPMYYQPAPQAPAPPNAPTPQSQSR